MAKINSKQKGARGEREWASFCKDQGYEVRRTQQYCGNTGDAADCIGLPGIHQEVKRVEKLNINDAMKQADRDCKEKIPIVAHKRNNGDWLVTMKAEHWFNFYREFSR